MKGGYPVQGAKVFAFDLTSGLFIGYCGTDSNGLYTFPNSVYKNEQVIVFAQYTLGIKDFGGSRVATAYGSNNIFDVDISEYTPIPDGLICNFKLFNPNFLNGDITLERYLSVHILGGKTMAATMSVQELNGAGPTATTVTTIRFCTTDAYAPALTYPIPIPTSGFNYSYWKTINLAITNIGTKINNVRFYCDGTIGFAYGSGGLLRIGIKSTGDNGITSRQLSYSQWYTRNFRP